MLLTSYQAIKLLVARREEDMLEKILVVDDKSSVRQLLQEYLNEQGFRVTAVTNGQEAIYETRREPPDLILLDIMMPKMDGYEFLRQYRKDHLTPVIIVTAREEESDAVLGLELGADDYIIKPFRMRELLARIHAVLRRVEQKRLNPVLRCGRVSLDLSAHTASVDDNEISLTPIEFDLLEFLLRSPGQVFTRTQLVDHLVESGFTGLERTLNVHIHNLRQKIEPDPDNPLYIETVFGIGYRLNKP